MPDAFPIFPRASLHLPGTVALPSPFPTLGHLWLPSSKQMPGLEDETELVAIGVSHPPSSTIVRYVQAKFIAAVFMADEGSDDEEETPINWKHGTWLFSPKYGDIKETTRAIIYVPESAPVITKSVFGQTAAESAECIGILLRRCDCF
jgi:hypothetical protein